MLWSVPAIVLIVAGALGNGAQSLTAASFNEAVRRAIVARAARSLSMSDLPVAARRPAETVEEAPNIEIADAGGAKPPAADTGADKDKDKAGDEADWRARMTAAREAVERDTLLAEAMQTRINSLTADVASRDDPAQRQQLIAQRNRALQELDRLKDQVENDKKAVADIEDDARRKGIPPGWIR